MTLVVDYGGTIEGTGGIFLHALAKINFAMNSSNVKKKVFQE